MSIEIGIWACAYMGWTYSWFFLESKKYISLEKRKVNTLQAADTYKFKPMVIDNCPSTIYCASFELLVKLPSTLNQNIHLPYTTKSLLD